MNNDSFDDIIKQKTCNHELPVPADAWNNIIKKEKKRRYPVFWWSLSSILLLCVLFMFIDSNKIAKNKLASNQINHSGKSLSPQDNSNNKSRNTQNVSPNNIENIKTQQKNNTDDKGLNKNDVSSKASQPGISVRSDKQTLPVKTITSSSNNTVPIVSNSSSKKQYYSQRAKYKSNIVNASTNNNAIGNTIIDTGKSLVAKNNKNDYSINPSEKKSFNNTNDTAAIVTQQKQATNTLTKVKGKETGITKTGNQNKLINTDKKAKALVLDFSITPFSAIQHYTPVQSVTRFSNSNNHSVYTADSVHTSISSSIAFGIAGRKSISKKISIGTGIQYSQIKESIKLSGIQTDTSYTIVQRLATNSSGPYLINDTTSSTNAEVRIIDALNSYRLYSVPLFINYGLITTNKFSLALTAGIYLTLAQYHNAINGKLQTHYSIATGVDNKQNRLIMDVFGGAHLSWNVSKSFTLFTEPHFRYNLKKYELNNLFINKYIHQAGLSIGYHTTLSRLFIWSLIYKLFTVLVFCCFMQYLRTLFNNLHSLLPQI